MPEVIHPAIKLTYAFFKRPLNAVLMALLGLAIYYLFGYAFAADQFILGEHSVASLLFYILVDQVLLESLTLLILFWLIVGYARVLKLDVVQMGWKPILFYELAFLPLIIGAFFIFNPVTQTLRFLLHYYPNYDWAIYWDAYFYNASLYGAYLGALLPIAYVSLNLNLLLDYGRQGRGEDTAVEQPAETEYLKRIVGRFGTGDKLVPIDEILWFEVEDRQYYACTRSERYRITKTIGELEASLDPSRFVRLNRSVIANIEGIDSFSSWMNGKYIVQMKDTRKTEFTLTKARAKTFKELLHQS